jgi:spore cortex formation protein SpoVR/YcgB (stage V sporulation)
VSRLWGFDVHLESVNSTSDVTRQWTVQAASD